MQGALCNVFGNDLLKKSWMTFTTISHWLYNGFVKECERTCPCNSKNMFCRFLIRICAWWVVYCVPVISDWMTKCRGASTSISPWLCNDVAKNCKWIGSSNSQSMFCSFLTIFDAWCMVQGAWCIVHGAWWLVHGAECTVCGEWCMMHCAWCLVHGAQCMAHCGVWCMMHCVWHSFE